MVIGAPRGLRQDSHRTAGGFSAAVGVDRNVEVAIELRVAAQQVLPGDLRPLAAALGHDLHPFGRDRHRVELALDLQLPLEGLVQTCGHRVTPPYAWPEAR